VRTVTCSLQSSAAHPNGQANGSPGSKARPVRPVREIVVLAGSALLLGGCVYNLYTGLWEPYNSYGYN
jgi:hypothetical protein